jgi:RHS repeat-associated protein
LLIRESEGADALLRRYVHGVDLISMSSGGSDFFFHYDPLGSVSNVTSSSGAAQWTHTYEPFGASRTEVQNDPSAPTTLMRFTGELIDSPTGLYHLRARQYDPVTGRFTSTDPLAPALNDPYVAGYVYANNRPTLLIDPSGMRGDWKQDCPFWGRLLTFGEWENVYCEGFLTMDPTWQGIWGATIQAAPPALAVALLGRACVAFSEVCARLSVKIWIHGPNHNFPGKGPRWHLFLNWWLKGVDRSHHIKQIPFPW